jgi:hypothetical protein
MFLLVIIWNNHLYYFIFYRLTLQYYCVGNVIDTAILLWGPLVVTQSTL